MYFDDAVKLACNEKTLTDAIAFICVWEYERAIKNIEETDNKFTTFKYCIEEVTKEFINKNRAFTLTFK